MKMNFSKCRLCLEVSSVLHPIFTTELFYNICETVEKYCGIKISKDDCLPHEICSICVADLEFVDKFIEKCKQSDVKLREDYINVDIKEESEYVADDHEYWEDVKIKDEDDTPLIKLEAHHLEYERHGKKSKKHKKMHKSSKKSKKNRPLNLNNEKYRGPCECDVCGLHLKSHSAMEIHARVHTGEKPYECSVCMKAFAQKNTLRIHIDRKHNTSVVNSIEDNTIKNDFYCETCGKAFKNRSYLKIHIRVHSHERPYKCDKCDSSFTQLGSLSIHQRRHRGERPYSCDICQKTFVEMSHLKRHSAVHSDARPFICSICGKGVKSSFALKQHLKLHSNCKEHICDKCGMSFKIKGSLNSHVRVVHSEKSGQCGVCNKICSNLDDHMTIHSGEKPHSCDICGKRFSKKRGLIIHLKQHSEKGRYKCSIPECGKTFYAHWILECHLLKHSGDTPYTCKLCKKGFVRVCHLTNHMKTNHPNEIECNNETKD